MYAWSSSQKTCFLSWRNPPTRSLSSLRRDRAAAPGGPVQQLHAVLLDERVLVRADVVPVPRGQVMRVVLEVGGEEADRPAGA